MRRHSRIIKPVSIHASTPEDDVVVEFDFQLQEPKEFVPNGVETRSVPRAPGQNIEVMEQTFLLLQHGEENVSRAEGRDIVLVLGNTGAGKSTLTQFLAGDNEKLFGTEIGFGEFIILDTNDKISTSDIKSKTIFPELVEDSLTKSAFVDCPGFSNTRSASSDIAATYLSKSFVEKAGDVKIIIAVSYPSVRRGVDSWDFINLLKHATRFIKNIDNFKQSIGLVVTKVDNNYVMKDLNLAFVNDNQVKLNISSFLKNVREELNNKVQSSKEDALFHENAVEMIDVFLSEEGSNYPNIALFRRPDKTGDLSTSELLQEAKTSLKELVHKSMKFVSKRKEDFGFTISEESRNKVSDVLDSINSNIFAEVKIIAKKIEEHFRSKEVDTGDPAELHNQLSIGFNLTTAAVQESRDLSNQRLIFKKIFNIVKSCEVINAEKHLARISKQIKYLNFLQLVSDPRILNLRPLEWITSFNEVIEYLCNASKWYSLLTDLYTKLSEYDIQVDTSRYNVADLDNWGKEGKEQGIQITFNNWEQFRNIIVQLKIRPHDNSKELKVDGVKLTALNNILRMTLGHRIEFLYSDVSLKVKGRHVKVSEVSKYIYSTFTAPLKEKIKYIEILASDTVFIDADLRFKDQMINVSIIAAKWDVRGSRRIVLDGDDGAIGDSLARADDGVLPGSNGKDGKQGSPGGAAGNFFGLGKQFVNGKQLTVTANGGQGGPGQQGGNGAEGRKGSDPVIPTDVPKESTLRFSDAFRKEWKVSLVSRAESNSSGFGGVSSGSICEFYNISGKDGGRGGNGGNGGSGGTGGEGGNIRIIALQGQAEVSTSSNDGATGRAGLGGRGGAGGKHGCTVKVRYYSYRFYVTIERNSLKEVARYCDVGSSSSGMDGSVSTNMYIRRNLNYNLFSKHVFHSRSTNAFKSYLREELMHGGQSKAVTQITDLLDNSETVLRLYDILGLMDELLSLERQFHKMKTNLDFLPYYRSLLNRLRIFSKIPIAKEPRKVLSYLYSATLSKICSLKNGSEGSHIIDIRGYLDLAISNINSWQDLTIKDTIEVYNQDYQHDKDIMITSANDFIDKQITTEIAKISDQIEVQIAMLINETISQQNAVGENRNKLFENRDQLKRALITRQIFGGLKLVGTAMGFLGPYGAAVGKVLRSTSTIGEAFVLDSTTPMHQRTLVAAGVKNLLLEAERNANVVKEKKLRALEEKLDLFTKTPQLNVNEQVEKIKTDLAAAKSGDSLDMDKIASLEGELKHQMEVQSHELLVNNVRNDLNAQKRAFKEIEQINTASRVADAAFDLYVTYKQDDAKIREMSAAIEAEKETINKLKQYEDNIYNTIMPMLTGVKETIFKLENELGDMRQAALDVSKWQIQTTLRDLKSHLQQFTKGYDLQTNLLRCIDKLNEAMTTLITVYDRIQSYQDQKKLADFISDVSSASATDILINDIELRKAIQKLKLIIKSNIILSQYERAVSSFKQYVFPFAEFYFEDYNLPTDIHTGNTVRMLVEKAVRNLISLKSKIGMATAVINKSQDTHIFQSEFHDHQSFYVWKSSSHKDVISQLLSGGVVTVKADVRESKQNAVKFNAIEIRLKSHDEALQADLDASLSDITVNMTHLGNSYYKCGARYYVIPSDSITISYSFRSKDGKPQTRNEVYNKLMRGDLTLSPYAMWRLQLYGSGFSRLRKYMEHVDVELVGRGTFVGEDAQICNTDLGEYYTADDHLSEISMIL